MTPVTLLGVFLAGISFGFPLGRMATVKVLGSVIRKMSQRILELEERLADQIADDTKTRVQIPQGSDEQVEVLERLLRRQS